MLEYEIIKDRMAIQKKYSVTSDYSYSSIFIDIDNSI